MMIDCKQIEDKNSSGSLLTTVLLMVMDFDVSTSETSQKDTRGAECSEFRATAAANISRANESSSLLTHVPSASGGEQSPHNSS